MNERLHDASRLISRHLDGLMTADEETRLAQLMREDAEVIDLYVRLMQVHGQLSWGAAHPQEPTLPVPTETATPHWMTPPSEADARPLRPVVRSHGQPSRRTAAWAVSASLLILLLVTMGRGRWLAEESRSTAGISQAIESISAEQSAVAEAGDVGKVSVETPLEPLRFESLHPPAADRTSGDREESISGEVADAQPDPVSGDVLDADVIAAIDEAIMATLRDNGVEPSPSASPEEWTRRAWLTLVGRIPSIEEMSNPSPSFGPEARAELVDRLLVSSERSRRLAEVWTSLLIGRTDRPRVDRSALQDYLFTAFEENRSWIQVVGELISAEGRSDQNGATNFLLAHLDNQATPATAVTARLFLGEQLQCVQCHHHPFSPERKQQEYWAFNAFFQNSQRAPVDEESISDGGRRPVRLVDGDDGGMTFFETLSGRQEAVEAAYDGQRIPASQRVSRRSVLADLLAGDSRSRVARAMVNRVWADFFGYGFTNPVDDMGPHATVSHPELLDHLTAAFVASGYDLRRLQRWIALSSAWERTSQAVAGNEQDSPESGEVPLFSRVYPRRMAPEQVYDSIRVAIRAVAGRSAEMETASDHRRQWVNQFVRPYDTDENDEADQFNGSVAQAMVMMNGDDINTAIRQAGAAFLDSQRQPPGPDRVLRQVSLAVLTRAPTQQETAVFRRHLNRLRRTTGYQDALPQVTEDMLWAYLNSSEFLLIH